MKEVTLLAVFIIGLCNCSKEHSCSEEELATCISQNLTFKQTDSEYVEYKKHKVLWDCWGIDHYRFTFVDWSVFCIFTTVTLEIKGSEILTVSTAPYRDDQKMYCTTTEYERDIGSMTIDQLYQIVEEAVDTDLPITTLEEPKTYYRSEWIRLEFDSIYGYPTLASFDYIRGIADEEYRFQIIDFEILD